MIQGRANTLHVSITEIGAAWQAVEKFLNWLDRFSERNMVKFTVTISADESVATEGMRNFL